MVKATNYDEVPPKEKHVATILKSLAEGRGYGDTLYILDGLMRRLNSGKHWVVILKVLTVVHRMLREGPQGTSADILRCVKENGPLWRLANYKDDAPGVADQSAFVRVYAGYLDARLKCVQELGMDVGREPVGGHSATRQMGTRELVEKLPLIQAQMEKATECFPQGMAARATPTLYACMTVIQDTFKLYRAVNDGVVNMLDKFFSMERMDAQRSFAIYKTSLQHTESLMQLYARAKTLDFANSIEFPVLDQPPSSLLQSMQEYCNEVARKGSVGAPASSGGSAGPAGRGSIGSAGGGQPALRQESANLLSFDDPPAAPAPVLTPPSVQPSPAAASTVSSFADGGFGTPVAPAASNGQAPVATPPSVSQASPSFDSFGDAPAFGAAAGGAKTASPPSAGGGSGKGSPSLDLDSLYQTAQVQGAQSYYQPQGPMNAQMGASPSMLQGMTQQFGGMGMGGQPAGTPPVGQFGGPPPQQPYGGGMAAGATNPFSSAPQQPPAAAAGGGACGRATPSAVQRRPARGRRRCPLPATPSEGTFWAETPLLLSHSRRERHGLGTPRFNNTPREPRRFFNSTQNVVTQRVETMPPAGPTAPPRARARPPARGSHGPRGPLPPGRPARDAEFEFPGAAESPRPEF